jgi:hypothetical protein
MFLTRFIKLSGDFTGLDTIPELALHAGISLTDQHGMYKLLNLNVIVFFKTVTTVCDEIKSTCCYPGRQPALAAQNRNK